MQAHSPAPVKLCDFDLCSDPTNIDTSTPTLLTPVGSLEYMAPEVTENLLTGMSKLVGWEAKEK